MITHRISDRFNLYLLVCQAAVEVRLSPCWSTSHLAITPEGYSRRQSKGLTAKSKAVLLGSLSGCDFGTA